MEKIKVDRKAAWEFAYYWAEQATKTSEWPGGREAWLWAYERYDFSQVNRLVVRRLRTVSEMFHKLNGGSDKSGR